MESWIMPCNIKFLDVVDHVRNNKVIVWKKSARIKTGDKVFIYVGAPYKEIRYLCKVTNEWVRS